MPPDVQIIDLDHYEPTDAQILSWYEMMTAPDQLIWEYDESWAHKPTTPQIQIDDFRAMRTRQTGHNHPLWAVAGRRVIGMVGINRPQEPSRQHCGELGYGVSAQYARRGIGSRLLTAAITKSRQLGIKRLEADCFDNNAASIALLCKCGFREEGTRPAAICKDGRLRSQKLFGLLL